MQHGKPRGVGLDREPRLDQLERAHLIGKVGAAAGGAAVAPTNVPLPRRRDTSPAFSSWSSARRTVLRAAWNVAANCRSGGSRSPSL